MKPNAILEKLKTKAPGKEIKVLEGYVAFSDKEKTRLFTSLTKGVYYDIPAGAILHDEEIREDQSGKSAQALSR